MEDYGGEKLVGCKVGFWLSQEGRDLLRGWAQEGLLQKQIAAKMGVSGNTLLRYKKKYPEIADCFAVSKEIADYQVENALREKALGGNVQAMIFLLKNSGKGTGNEADYDEGVCIVDDL